MTKDKKNNKRIRVNITLDAENLEKAKKKIAFFGGKLSTLFNMYLSDFVASMDKDISDAHKEMEFQIKELEVRIKKLEEK